MYSRFSAAVRFLEPPLGTRFRALGGQPCAPTPQSWLRIPGVDRQPGRLRPRRRLHTSEPRREPADAVCTIKLLSPIHQLRRKLNPINVKRSMPDAQLRPKSLAGSRVVACHLDCSFVPYSTVAQTNYRRLS